MISLLPDDDDCVLKVVIRGHLEEYVFPILSIIIHFLSPFYQLPAQVNLHFSFVQIYFLCISNALFILAYLIYSCCFYPVLTTVHLLIRYILVSTLNGILGRKCCVFQGNFCGLAMLKQFLSIFYWFLLGRENKTVPYKKTVSKQIFSCYVVLAGFFVLM